MISPRTIHTHWNQLLTAFKTHEKQLVKDALFPRNICTALLYMLHVNLHYPAEQSHSRRNRNVDVSWLRWQLVCRFAVWVPCACKQLSSVDCRREWNFVRKVRLSRGTSSAPCEALGWLNDNREKRKAKSIGAEIDRQNGLSFFTSHQRQLPRADGPS